MDAVEQFADKLGLPVPKTFFIGGASKVNKYLKFFFFANRILFFF
jgi:hypothetical protein